MGAEYIFAFAYLVCAGIALQASRLGYAVREAAGANKPFWNRIAIICGLFAVLRVAGAQRAVSSAFASFNHAEGLQHWERPGPYLMLAAIVACGVALAGLLVFRRRASHASIISAASAIVGLVLLALAHSLSLYLPIAVLQTEVGALTISRIVEVPLLAILGTSGLAFISHSRRRSHPRSTNTASVG